MTDTSITDEFQCKFCKIEVTVDNIGLTLEKGCHICKDCIKTDAGLEILESRSKMWRTVDVKA